MDLLLVPAAKYQPLEPDSQPLPKIHMKITKMFWRIVRSSILSFKLWIWDGMGNFTRATFLFHVSSDLIRLDAKVCSESSPELGDDAAMTRGENNMVLLDARCRTLGRWDADTDIDMHNIAAYSEHLGRLC